MRDHVALMREAEAEEAVVPSARSLAQVLGEVMQAADAADFPLALPGADQAQQAARALRAQLDDYVIPRLRRFDAPLLAVVGGSTGAGKSTLVNGLVRAPVARAGVLRPTTRSPLLACHPADLPWFAQAQVLPELVRSSQPGEHTVQLVNTPALSPGLALLDAPDIDSVVAENRELAAQLLDAADLWLFVTTAARYADAVPWRLLRQARARGIATAIVLDRVPAAAREEIAGHYRSMLADLGPTALFVVTESELNGQGLLPEAEVEPIQRWLRDLTLDRERQWAVAGQTLLGALNAAGEQVGRLAEAAKQQAEAAAALAGAVREAFDRELATLASDLASGALLRGPAYDGWRNLRRSGELTQALRAHTGPRRAQFAAALADRPPPGRRLQERIIGAVAERLRETDLAAVQRVREAWQATPAGVGLLRTQPELGQPWPGFADAAHDVAYGWHAWLRSAVRGRTPRTRGRTRSYATAAMVLLATVAAVAPTEPEIAAGPPADVQAWGDQARAELVRRCQALLEAEVRRHQAALIPDPGAAQRLSAAHAALTGSESA